MRLMLFVALLSSKLPAGEVGRLPTNWYTLPENESLIQAKAPASQENFSAVHNTFSGILEAANKALNEVHTSDSAWDLKVVGTTLGINTYGLLGLMILSGTATLRLFWTKAPAEDKKITKADLGEHEISIREGMTSGDIRLVIEPAMKIAAASKKIKDLQRMRTELEQRAKEFQSLVVGLDDAPDRVPWKIQAMVLDVSVFSTGMVAPAISIGGQLGLRFIWRRNPQYKVFHTASAPSKLKKFFANLSTDISAALHEMPLNFGYEPVAFRMGIGMSASGSIYVAKTGFNTLLQIFLSANPAIVFPFDSKEDNIEQEPDMLVAGTGSPGEKKFAAANQISFTTQQIQTASTAPKSEAMLYKVSRRNFREGLKRAFALTGFFMAKIENKPQQKWILFLIETMFELSITGSMGFSSITGTSTCGVQFLKKKEPALARFRDEVIF